MKGAESNADGDSGAAMPTVRVGVAERNDRRGRRALVLVVGVILVSSVWLFREPLRRSLIERMVLANDAPNAEVVTDMIVQAREPQRALLAAWNTRNIVHRQVAIRTLSSVLPPDEIWPPALESLALGAALDPDFSVRRSALGALHDRKHPAWAALAAAQLRDVDQEVRSLGLNHLRFTVKEIGVPAVVALLDDPDPLIVTLSLKLLERWSGESFGVRLSETVAFKNEQTGLEEYRAGSHAKARAGAERAKGWWRAHQTEFEPTRLEVPREAYSARQPVPASDFELSALDGRKVRLSDLRGQVVLLNFWTTWCTACVGEMPALIELQRRHADDLVIIGVSLDFVPDSHGHIGGHAAVEEQDHSDGHHDDDESSVEALERVRRKVVRTVKARGINYPILLDEKNEVGGRFNGGELPTTVIVDAQGNVRRRFVGARSLPVFEAMIKAASIPPATFESGIDKAPTL